MIQEYKAGLVSLTHDRLIRSAAAKRPYKEAIVDISSGKRITYQELWLKSNKVANFLIGLGIKKGDKVVTLGRECGEFPLVWTGIMKMGGVKVGLNWRYTPRELEQTINLCDAKAIILRESHIDIIQSIRSKLRQVEHFIVIGNKVPEGMYSYEELIDKASDDNPKVDISSSDMCAIFFTTGTTAVPKAAVRRHSDYIAAIICYCWQWHYEPQTRELNCLPNFHIGGHYMIDGALYLGGTSYVLGEFDPEKYLQVVDKERITFSALPPTVMGLILALPDEIKSRYDTSSMKTIGSGGSVYPKATKIGAKKLFPNAELHDAYNATEMGISIVEPEDMEKYDRCVGEPMLGTEVKIFDKEGKEVPKGQDGIIYARGPSVITEYYKNKEAYEKCTIKDPDGDWFTVEDMGRIDPETNLLYITGRTKDVIISGDENVSPAEVEGVIMDHPAVAEVAVIGIPDPKWGEKVTAIIRLKPGQILTAEEINNFCRERLAGFKVPKSFKFTADALPRKGFKIDKDEVMEMYKKGIF